jgi:hypothetical protein
VLRMAKAKAGPVVTDNGNFVIDAPFEEELYKDPHSLLAHIKMLTGVVEVGLFCGMAKAAYFGNQVRCHRSRCRAPLIHSRMEVCASDGQMAERKLCKSQISSQSSQPTAKITPKSV